MSEKFDYTDNSRIRVVDGGVEYVPCFVGDCFPFRDRRIVAWRDGEDVNVHLFDPDGKIPGAGIYLTLAPADRPIEVTLANGDVVREGDITVADGELYRLDGPELMSFSIWRRREWVSHASWSVHPEERLATASELAASTIPLTDGPLTPSRSVGSTC